MRITTALVAASGLNHETMLGTSQHSGLSGHMLHNRQLSHLGGGARPATADRRSSCGRPRLARTLGFFGSFGSWLSPPFPPPSRRGRLLVVRLVIETGSSIQWQTYLAEMFHSIVDRCLASLQHMLTHNSAAHMSTTHAVHCRQWISCVHRRFQSWGGEVCCMQAIEGAQLPVGHGAAALDIHGDAFVLHLAAVRHLVCVLHVVLVLEFDEGVPAGLAWVHAQWQPRRLPGAITCGASVRRLHDVPEHLSSCKHGVTGGKAAAAAAAAASAQKCRHKRQQGHSLPTTPHSAHGESGAGHNSLGLQQTCTAAAAAAAPTALLQSQLSARMVLEVLISGKAPDLMLCTMETLLMGPYSSNSRRSFFSVTS
jgi:hypothetical protein